MHLLTGSNRILIGILFYCTGLLLPFGVALLRNKRNKLAIFAMNVIGGLFFGDWMGHSPYLGIDSPWRPMTSLLHNFKYSN